ncbi:OadG-related small transporter subunit [Zongyangia hominis]|uniref:Oxaloacetate decarboxylase n=1 Tax=Zongyangia hominis TaxID=2763677 RepID=A0A926EAD0_9FIRM|nr:OadG-related small transporter subunit [Zongyangia hominis]MBC8570247.1 hypothetical protein [Zongyangia hominis]
MNVDMNALSQSFELMGKGMLGIFVVIGLIFLLVVLLTKFTSGKKPKEDE